MTIFDLKQEIKKVIEEVPESALIEVLDFLKKVKEQPDLKKNLLQILEEDKGLLQRLAL